MSPQPAWSAAFTSEELARVERIGPLEQITRDWAWAGSTGAGVKVAVIDSGIDAEHPAVGGRVEYVSVGEEIGEIVFDVEPHGDEFGHGTACAGIIRGLAPDCSLYSIKVLGPRLRGRGAVFTASLRWAIDNGMDVCNLSLGTTKREFFASLHELVDEAYFRNVVLVAAANNMPMPSYPSLYSSLISVASHSNDSPEIYFYNPHPPPPPACARVSPPPPTATASPSTRSSPSSRKKKSIRSSASATWRWAPSRPRRSRACVSSAVPS